MPRGGARPGAGRKPKASQPVKKVIDIGPSGTPLDFMLAMLRDPEVDPGRRARMAHAAAPYCHARLALGKKERAMLAAQLYDLDTPLSRLMAEMDDEGERQR